MDQNTILIFSGNFKVIDLVRAACVGQELTVLNSTNRTDAWRTIEKRLPKVVILDMMDPEMDTWKVCELIREKYMESIRIIMLVSEGWEPMESVLGFVPIPDEYIVKPFDPHDLVSKVKLRLSDNSDLAGRN
jgi:two-component system sensor histidine kinase ChiS